MRKCRVLDNGLGVPEPLVLRLHLRSTIKHVNHAEQEAYCLAESGWAGVGWGCWSDTRATLSWDEYQQAKREAGERLNPSVRRLHAAPDGSLVWTRRRDGTYWLGELAGPWEYRADEHARKLDIFNRRPCRWWEVGTEDAVPGKVINNFRARVTLNVVSDAVAVRYTRRLHHQLAGRSAEVESLDPADVIRSLLSPEEVEDLVSVYLQDRHNLVLVARGHSTPGYEYVLRDRATGQRVVASVKSGGTPVDLDLLPDSEDIHVFIYSTSGRWRGHRHANVREITTADLVEFLNERRHLLPDLIARWME